MKKILALVMALSMILALAACGSSADTAALDEVANAVNDLQSQVDDLADAVNNAAPAAPEAAPAEEPAAEVVDAVVEEEAAEEEPEGGFAEIPIWEDEEVGFLNVNGVYFQPVPMSGGQENFEDYDMHFEADVSALPNDLGYGVGDWVPYMNVAFEIIGSDGEVAAEGNFMPMNADDGPHYGANIALPEADTYSVRLSFDIDQNAYLIHLDDETGPGGNFDEFEWPLVLELDDVWDYAPVEW